MTRPRHLLMACSSRERRAAHPEVRDPRRLLFHLIVRCLQQPVDPARLKEAMRWELALTGLRPSIQCLHKNVRYDEGDRVTGAGWAISHGEGHEPLPLCSDGCPSRQAALSSERKQLPWSPESVAKRVDFAALKPIYEGQGHASSTFHQTCPAGGAYLPLRRCDPPLTRFIMIRS